MEPTTFETAYSEVKKLVQKFENNKDHFMSPVYSEVEARQDFIDKFFIALGWDVTHQYQHDPYRQEVKIERSQKQQNESARKRADYAFFSAPNFKDVIFFVEAKKPSVLIRQNPAHYFQTIKYGWNASCPISILTDFEEFVIIDCRSRPNIKYALNGRHKSYSYTDYLDKEKFAEIYYLFSKEAITNDSIEKYVDTLPKAKGKVTQKQLFKGGYQAIDDSFLEYIDGVRETIAKAFKKTNPELDSEMLTEATQRTVDRLVFVRFLEDKFIEPINHINDWASNINPWKAFIQDCRALNVKYNGIVFKPLFIDKDDFLGADASLFGDICNELSSDNSPYDFNYIPIHILGSIYERFLGKVVIATAKQAHIEEKPEVRKAGGVYYTPKYIVDYIVRNTVGDLIEGKSPAKIAEMSFADIACGSGSFLIGVYDYLLQYHKEFYLKNPNAAKKDGCIYVDGVWALSIKQKQNILLNNIYGVDIDSQAVEVTQLSLFLKMLEDETMTSTMEQARQTSMYTKVLPDLTKNIKCGNSLIGTNILTDVLFNEESERKINAMDFSTTFSKVFSKGGFDVILGNPPYVNIENLDETTKRYFFQTYSTCKGRTDIYVPFIEKNLSLIKENGFISYIIPYAFINQNYGASLRKLLIENYYVKEIVDTSNYYVFKQAKVKNITITIQKCQVRKRKTKIKNYLSAEDFESNRFSSFDVFQKEFQKLKDYRFETKPVFGLLDLKERIWKKSIPLEKVCLIAYGARLNHKFEAIKKEYYIHNDFKKGFKPFLEGKNIERYYFEQFGWLDYKPNEHYNSMFPELFESEKLVFINVVKDRLRFAYDSEGYYNSHTVINCIRNIELINAKHQSARKAIKDFGVELSKNYSIKFLLGILNSRLATWYFYNFQSEALHFYPNDAKNLPIVKIDQTRQEDRLLHDKVVSLVELMLDSKSKVRNSVLEKDKDYYENKITSLDDQIDNLVYQLYNLTSDDIELIKSTIVK